MLDVSTAGVVSYELQSQLWKPHGKEEEEDAERIQHLSRTGHA